MQVFPIKIREGKLDIPEWLRDPQYVRFWEYSGPDAVVKSLINLVDNQQS
jgi:hypothetical protein